MTLDELIARAVEPIRRRVMSVVGRAVLSAIDDSEGLQVLQVELLDGETRGDLERIGNYGFTSRPLKDAEAVVLFAGGKKDNGFVICVDDRRSRLKDLAEGESALYNKFGAKILMKANGDIEVTPKSGQKILLKADVDVDGTLTASTDVVGGGKSLKNHVHAATGTPPMQDSLLGPVSGSTAAPT